MSIGVGTLQPKTRVMRPVWLAGLLALVLAITLAVIVTSSSEEPARDAVQTETAISGTAANTPTELRFAGSAFSGTVVNTPTELSGGMPATSTESQPIIVSGDVCHQCR